MSRRAWAVLATLFVAAAGAIILGHRRAALMSFGADLVALAIGVAGGLWAMPALLGLALAVALVVRVNQIVQAVRLPPKPDAPTAGRAVLLILTLIVGDTLIAHGARTWLVEAFRIPAGSMIPALQVGDHIYVDKRATRPTRGDVIVFKYPREPDKDFIKRVIGVGGDTISIGDDGLMLNGKLVAWRPVDGKCSYQDYNEEIGRWEPRGCRAFDETIDGRSWPIHFDVSNSFLSPRGPWTVPSGHYFVMGDNRDNSHDSRFWGFVPAENVKGTARWIWWSSGPDGVRGDRIGEAIR